MMVVYGLFRFGPIEWHFTLVKDTFWNVVVMGVGRFFSYALLVAIYLEYHYEYSGFKV